MTETLTTAERIAHLNDQLRQGNTKLGEIRSTQTVKALPPEQQQKLLQLVRDFNSFESGNDPYGERDFLAIQLDSRNYFFKIDYFDRKAWVENREVGSEYPEDPDKTWRVATLMKSCTKAAFSKDNSGNLTEILFHLFLDSSNQWQLTIPLQTTTRTSCQPLDNSSYSTALIECHSHGEMPAFFSSTDDADERGFRLYAVLGKVNTLNPEILVRIGIFGHYSLIKASSVFEEPYFITDAYQNSLKPRL